MGSFQPRRDRGLDLHPGLRLAASLALIIAGFMTPALAWLGWMRTERSLRESQPLPSSPMGIMLGGAAMVAGVLLLLAILWR